LFLGWSFSVLSLATQIIERHIFAEKLACLDDEHHLPVADLGKLVALKASPSVISVSRKATRKSPRLVKKLIHHFLCGLTFIIFKQAT
jgi:hypothetical protein